MVVLLVVIGVVLIVFGGVLLVRPSVITAIEGAGLRVSAPAGLIIMVIGAAGVWYPLSPYYKPSGPDETLSRPSSTGAMDTSAIAPAPIAFTSPLDGTKVGNKFSVNGTAPGLGKRYLWLLIWAKSRTTPGMVYYRTSDTPLGVTNGTWSAYIGPLNETGKEIDAAFQLKLVLATPWCSGKLAHVAPNSSGEVAILELPPGCANVGEPLNLTKKS